MAITITLALLPVAKGELDGFTWALPYGAANLDPIKSSSCPENTILANLCASVVHLTPDRNLQRELGDYFGRSGATWTRSP